MQVVADVVLTNLSSGISQKSGKEYYTFEGVIVGCQDLPVLSGIGFKKFITKEVFEELSTLTHDRFDCSIGLSRVAVNNRDCDLGFNLFINGFPKEPEEEMEALEKAPSDGNVSPSPSVPEKTVSDKNKK